MKNISTKKRVRLASLVLGFIFAGAAGLWMLEQHPQPAMARETANLNQAPQANAAKVLYQCPMHPQVVQDHPGDCPICHMHLQKIEDTENRNQESGVKKEEASTGKVLYQCPMHPQIVQDHPGDCPICHMHLQKLEDGDRPSALSPQPSRQPHQIIKWRNPMNPNVFSDHPMKDEMGMDYIPVYADEAGAAEDLPGRAAFSLSPQRQQLIGVRFASVEKRALQKTIRLSGRLGQGARVLAELLEIDAGAVKPGLRASLQGPQGQRVEAVVEQVSSSLDGITRSFALSLRAKAQQPWMKPGLFCQVELLADLGRHTAIPQEALLDTGQRQIVFVSDGKGRFQPRQVEIGQQGDEWLEVKKGLSVGEQVVSSANFLIDSESQFRAALKQY